MILGPEYPHTGRDQDSEARWAAQSFLAEGDRAPGSTRTPLPSSPPTFGASRISQIVSSSISPGPPLWPTSSP